MSGLFTLGWSSNKTGDLMSLGWGGSSVQVEEEERHVGGRQYPLMQRDFNIGQKETPEIVEITEVEFEELKPIMETFIKMRRRPWL